MHNINDVIKRLDEIIDWSQKNESPIGYFAALYRQMTISVGQGITQNKFENGPRMAQMDLIFAQRYFDAFDNFQNNKPNTNSWKIAFDATKNPSITVIQHLILGINAHINLDLCIAWSQTCPNYQINKLAYDFNQINVIISGLIDETKQKLSKIWLPFRIFSDLLKTESDGIINFSIKVARGISWENAKTLAFAPPLLFPTQITSIDNEAYILAQKILEQKWYNTSILWIIRQGEAGKVSEKIALLK